MTDAAARTAITPPAAIAFIGLGQMGLPMARQLVGAGYRVRGNDLSRQARDAFAAFGEACDSACEAARGADVVITMLPDGKIVRSTLMGASGAASALERDALVIDMSSSAPTETTGLAAELQPLGIDLIDAPVSGGVKRAVEGALTIMVGGDAANVEAARPLLDCMAKSVFATGPIGSGHAMKALNNYVSAAGLVAASEAIIMGRRFGLDPNLVVDILNVSTGRNNSTEVKMKQFVLSESFASGFSLALMAKDLRTAADLAEHLGLDMPFAALTADLWGAAKGELPPGADHTAIYRFLAKDR